MNHLLSKKYYQKIGKHKIDWEIIKNDKIKYDGIFTMSFYRKEGYESNSPEFLVYKDGLKNMIINIYNINKKLKSGLWKIRIYYEESVQNDINEIINENIENIDYFEFFKYSFELFLDETKKHHYKSFGMFMRLLPFLNDKNNKDILISYENNKKSNIKHYEKRVLNVDIDQNLKYDTLQFIKDLYKNKIEFGYRTYEGYNLYKPIEAYKVINKDNLLDFWSIINNFIYQYNIYYPYDLFSNFFEKAVNEWLTNARNEKYKNYNMSIFGYGYDEFFTNNYMLNEYLKKKVNIKILLKPHYFTIFYGLISFICEHDKLFNDKIIKDYVKSILELFYFNKNIKNKIKNIVNNKNDLNIKLLLNQIGSLKGTEKFQYTLHKLLSKAYLINKNNVNIKNIKEIIKNNSKMSNKNNMINSKKEIKKGIFFKKIFNYIKKIFYKKDKINKNINIIIHNVKEIENIKNNFANHNMVNFPHTQFLNIIDNIQVYMNYKYNIDYAYNLLKSIKMMKLLVPLGIKSNNLGNLLDKSYIISDGNKNIKLIKVMKNNEKKIIPLTF